MKKVILLGNKGNLLKTEHGLHCLSGETRGITKDYYNLHDKKVEVISVSNEKYLSGLKDIRDENAIIVILEDKFKFELAGNKEKVCYLYNIDNYKYIDMEDVFLLLGIFVRENNKNALHRMIGLGDGEYPISSIVIQILKRINLIECCRKCSIKLVVGKELNLQEVSDLEDPIREYLMDNTELVITQEIKSNIRNKIYFSLIGE